MTDKKNLPAVNDDAVDAPTDAYLRAESIVNAINANLPPGARRLVPIPKEYVFKKIDREAVSAAFHAAFQMIGGVPRFAEWAASNPKDFFALYSKLLPSNTETPVGNFQFQFVTPIPETPQDRVAIADDGKIITAETEELPE